MGVYLPDAKMPSDCQHCEFARAADCVKWIGYFFKDKFNPECPLIEGAEAIIKKIKEEENN